MRSTRIVTSFLKDNDKFLFLKRSNEVKTMKGLWAGVSGIIEKNEEPLRRAKIEVFEEVGITENKIKFLTPQMIEGKAKASEPEDVLDYVLKKFGFSSVLKNKKVLLTAGPTVEHIDPIRVITNLSSGKTGVSLAYELVSAGAKVTLIYGPGKEKPPKVYQDVAPLIVVPKKSTKNKASMETA